MTQTTAVIAIIGVLVVNHLIMAVGSLRRSSAIYLAITIVNGVTAGMLLAYGVPGFEAWPGARFLFAGIFVYRIVMNHVQRTVRQREERHEALADEQKRVRALADREREAQEEGEPGAP